MRAFVDAEADLVGQRSGDLLQVGEHRRVVFARHGEAIADQDDAVDTGLGDLAELVDLLRQAAGGMAGGDDGYAPVDVVEDETG